MTGSFTIGNASLPGCCGRWKMCNMNHEGCEFLDVKARRIARLEIQALAEHVRRSARGERVWTEGHLVGCQCTRCVVASQT